MKIKFLGAVNTVTGSAHLIEYKGKRLLLDCGMFQGKREPTEILNRNMQGFEGIDAVLISHSHIDHTGRLPLLFRNILENNRTDVFIYATNATVDITELLLLDSAHIQEENIKYLRKKGRIPSGKEPLYTTSDVEAIKKFFIKKDYEEVFEPIPGIKAKFIEAGHILGSAQILIKTEEGKTLLYTGDIGRQHLPIIRDRRTVKEANVIISETTYGDRLHEPYQGLKKHLKDIIVKTVKRHGKIIIPSFALGRAQEIIYLLHEMRIEKEIPFIEIFIDSPLAREITQVFRKYHNIYDKDAKSFFHKFGDIFSFKGLTFTSSVEESKYINSINRPIIIIAASGMCEGGRVVHHLKQNIENYRNTILIIGYQAVETLGRKLLDKNLSTVRILGEEYIKKSSIIQLHEFSAHADKNDLVNMYEEKDKTLIENIFLVHGEERSLNSFKNTLLERGFKNIHIPQKIGDSFEI